MAIPKRDEKKKPVEPEVAKKAAEVSKKVETKDVPTARTQAQPAEANKPVKAEGDGLPKNVGAFVGVDRIYQNAANPTDLPLEPTEDDDDGDGDD